MLSRYPTGLSCLTSRNLTEVSLRVPPFNYHWCPSLRNSASNWSLHIFPDSVGYPLGVPHSSLSYTMHCLSELSSLPITRNTRTTHPSRLSGFGFDVILSWVNCNNRYLDRSWQDDQMDEEWGHMLEDLLTTGWMYQAHQETSERNICIEPSCKTKTIEDPTTLSHANEKTKHTKSTSITQKWNILTRTPRLVTTCQ